MATFGASNKQSIGAAFDKFHRDNPRVYARFRHLALRLIEAGKKRCSSKSILCALRFEEDLETKSVTEYKINDAFTSRYARLFVQDHPEHDGFFEMRKIRSE